uniref:NADH dehydrogenase subunit 9 n=1 Tax=Caulerpa lentillifera TaxID=148947 RepID=A0A2Z2QKY6_9CHLO|nr:NADH dehydrogenase subunit 9 [Caulerpa lentillifera]AST24261.1 NADH dehydrogenase subunit 9 [Caulerpa lentillifera]QKS32221.1 NADH dehydrogenase subunit 9 [Caulerpa lentillifera]
MCVRFSTNIKDRSGAIGTDLHRVCPEWVSAIVVRHGESVLYVHPKYIRSFLLLCRDSMLYQIKACIDMCCVDYPFRQHRFTLVYMLCSVHYNFRLRVKTLGSEMDHALSVTPLYASAGWCEREIWDMFGVGFVGHEDLRRLLTDYGFQGHPLRKDFPLSGYSEFRYDDSEKRVIEEPLELSQELRNFKYLGR